MELPSAQQKRCDHKKHCRAKKRDATAREQEIQQRVKVSFEHGMLILAGELSAATGQKTSIKLSYEYSKADGSLMDFKVIDLVCARLVARLKEQGYRVQIEYDSWPTWRQDITFHVSWAKK